MVYNSNNYKTFSCINSILTINLGREIHSTFINMSVLLSVVLCPEINVMTNMY